MPYKRKNEISPEVQEAVNDLLNGTSVDSAGQWLQREYIRLLRREANFKKAEKIEIESNSKKNVDTDGNGRNTE